MRAANPISTSTEKHLPNAVNAERSDFIKPLFSTGAPGRGELPGQR
jgi:hypothetical protein